MKRKLFPYGIIEPYILGLSYGLTVSKLTIIGSDKGLSPGRRQAIIRTNDGILLIWTNIGEILIEIIIFSFKNIWKCRLPYVGHFVLAWTCQLAYIHRHEMQSQNLSVLQNCMSSLSSSS